MKKVLMVLAPLFFLIAVFTFTDSFALFESSKTYTTGEDVASWTVKVNDDILSGSSDEFTVELSLAGYPKEQLKVYTKEGKLVVENDREVQKAERDYLYRGIASRDFTWSMKLPEFSTIKKVTYENGLLKIDVKIEIPEERKAKYIDIE